MICQACGRDVVVEIDRCPWCRTPLGEQPAQGAKRTDGNNGADGLQEFSLLRILVFIIGLVEKTDWTKMFTTHDEKNLEVLNYGKFLLCFLIARDQRLTENEVKLFNNFWRGSVRLVRANGPESL